MSDAFIESPEDDFFHFRKFIGIAKILRSPKEMAGNNKPLLPVRLYFMELYLFSDAVNILLWF